MVYVFPVFPYLLHIFYGQPNIPYRVIGVVVHICFTYFTASQTYHTELWVWWSIFASHILQPVKHTIQSHGCGGPYLFHIFYSQSNIPYRVIGVVAHVCFTYFTANQTYHTESWVWWPIFASHILQPVKHTIQSYRCGGPCLLHIFYSQSTYHTESWVWWPIFASHILQPVKHTIQSYRCGGPCLLHIFYSQSNIPYRVMGVVAHVCFTYFTASQTYHTEL